MSRKTNNYKTPRLPKQSKTLPIYGNSEMGNGLDAGRYFRCWNCGFVCRVDRDALGDKQARPAVGAQSYVPQPDPNTERRLVMLDEDEAYLTMESGADGSAKTPRLPYEAVVNGGCPFCGTLNWRGDF